MKLVGKKVVVLGGTSGIGFAVAAAALDEGASVTLASSNADKVARAADRLGGKAHAHVLDLADNAEISAFFEKLGEFDHLVYTAGESLLLEELETLDLERARSAFDIRYWGAVAAVKYARPHIRSGGSIVLSSGMASRKPRKTWAIASSVCGALESLTKALAVELAPLRVNVVCPGLVKTELWDGLPDAGRQAMYDRAASVLPVAHPGEPDELAQAYLYAMTAGFTTGSVVVADGGASLI